MDKISNLVKNYFNQIIGGVVVFLLTTLIFQTKQNTEAIIKLNTTIDFIIHQEQENNDKIDKNSEDIINIKLENVKQNNDIRNIKKKVGIS